MKNNEDTIIEEFEEEDKFKNNIKLVVLNIATFIMTICCIAVATHYFH